MHLPRHAEMWLSGYLSDRAGHLFAPPSKPKRVWLSIGDHYEPLGYKADMPTAGARVQQWREKWPQIAESVGGDSFGNMAKYTFFYPQEEYRRELLEPLAEMVRLGIGDVEIHIHHDREGEENFVTRMKTFCQTLMQDHGLLRMQGGKCRFGFIHGNWALDNSLPGGRWCGLNNEITLLRDLGCYADFTMPSGNSASQARLLNKIYWCTDNPTQPKSYNDGVVATPGGGRQGDLLMIPGPFGLRWKQRLMPRLETGELAGYDLPDEYRVRRWFDLAPQLGDDLFIKLYSHGAKDVNLAPLLDGGLARLFQCVRAEAEKRGIAVIFATCWEMYCAVEAILNSAEPQTQSGILSGSTHACG